MTYSKYEIMTHGTSGRWSFMRACQKHWMDKVATTLDEAVAVCELIKADGYGVCLFENGRRLLSAPWQIQVAVGVIEEIN